MMDIASTKLEETIKELKERGIEEEWIKGMIIHLSDVFGAGAGHLESLYDYLEAIAFQRTPPHLFYSIQYKIIEPLDNHQMIVCIWVEEE